MKVNLVALLVPLLASLISVYQLNCLLLFLNATVYPGFHTGGGGGGGGALGSPPPPPPQNSQGCYCITYKQVYYSRHSNRSNNIKSTVKYIKVQLDYSKIRQIFSSIFLLIALKLGVVYDIVGVS